MALALGWMTTGCSLPAQLTTGTGVAAKQLCSLVFVSELEPVRASALYVDPLLRESSSIMRTQVDREARSVRVGVPGVVSQRALHHPGYGCTLVRNASRRMERAPRKPRPSRPMTLDRAHREAHFDSARLEAAIARAFTGDPGRPPLNTLAVAVLHDGALVAERYAPGVSSETRLPGWSMTKSVTATLVGVLAHQGRLEVHAAGAIREWRGSSDPRSRITLDHLLRMTSGLALQETSDRGDGTDPTSILLYHEADAAGFAATRKLDHEPGTRFEYMSGNTVLAARAAQEAIGGGLEENLDFLHEELFSPLGMHGAVFESDQAGTLLGSTHMLASARDWARLGQLHLDGGVSGGRRLLSPAWLDHVTAPTPTSTAASRHDVFWEPGRSAYGAGFWLYGEADTGLPADSFDANGFQGQYLHIVPSKRLVVVRLGATNYRDHDHDRLPREVIASMLRTGELPQPGAGAVQAPRIPLPRRRPRRVDAAKPSRHAISPIVAGTDSVGTGAAIDTKRRTVPSRFVSR